MGAAILDLTSWGPPSWTGSDVKNSIVAPILLKETRYVTMNIFRFFYIFFKLFVKKELSYVFTINMFNTAENSRESEI